MDGPFRLMVKDFQRGGFRIRNSTGFCFICRARWTRRACGSPYVMRGVRLLVPLDGGIALNVDRKSGQRSGSMGYRRHCVAGV